MVKYGKNLRKSGASVYWGYVEKARAKDAMKRDFPP